MNKKTTPFPLLLVAIGGVLLSLAIFLTATRSPREAQSTQTPASALDEASIPRVSLENAKAALDAGTAVFVDVRGTVTYALGHVPGASSIPLAEVERRLNELNPDQWIIPYCT